MRSVRSRDVEFREGNVQTSVGHLARSATDPIDGGTNSSQLVRKPSFLQIIYQKQSTIGLDAQHDTRFLIDMPIEQRIRNPIGDLGS